MIWAVWMNMEMLTSLKDLEEWMPMTYLHNLQEEEDKEMLGKEVVSKTLEEWVVWEDCMRYLR